MITFKRITFKIMKKIKIPAVAVVVVHQNKERLLYQIKTDHFEEDS